MSDLSWLNLKKILCTRQSVLFLSGRPAVAEALSGKRESHVAHFIRSLKPLGLSNSATETLWFPTLPDSSPPNRIYEKRYRRGILFHMLRW